jgi:glutathione S-transferase
VAQLRRPDHQASRRPVEQDEQLVQLGELLRRHRLNPGDGVIATARSGAFAAIVARNALQLGSRRTRGPAMLTVHHLGVSQSERIVWLCEELGLDYALIRYERIPPGKGMAPPEYKALHPLGTAPTITDGEVVLAESGAITDYILARYGEGRLAVAPDQPNFADYLFWLHFANGSFMPAHMTVMMLKFLGVEGAGAGFVAERAERLWGLVEARLCEAPYLAGPDLTAADVMMGFPLTRMGSFLPHDISAYPRIRAYLQRIAARPAYQRAMRKAEPDRPLQID